MLFLSSICNSYIFLFLFKVYTNFSTYGADKSYILEGKKFVTGWFVVVILVVIHTSPFVFFFVSC